MGTIPILLIVKIKIKMKQKIKKIKNIIKINLNGIKKIFLD